jgi:hypothetical protein
MPICAKQAETFRTRADLSSLGLMAVVMSGAGLAFGIVLRIMFSRAVAGFSCAFLCLSCNLGKGEDPARPLPAPEPASSIVPSRPAAAPPPTPAPRPKDPERAAGKATATTTTTSGSTPAPTATATSSADAGSPATPAPAPLPTSLPTFDAGAISATCLPKCQASLSACISKPVPLDAGFPSLESMAECKKLFEDCQSACK